MINTSFTASTYKNMQNTTFKSFKTVQSRRHKALEREITPKDKIKAGLGSILGTLIPMLLIMKKQKIKNPLHIEYSIKEMVALAGTSIAAGVGFGMIGENKKTSLNKIKEGIFQFFNASIPVLFTGAGLKLCESSKKLNNTPCKIAATGIGILTGVLSASKLSNKLCDPYNKEPDRKLTLKDSIVNIDDLLGALALAKIPIIKDLKVERFLPLIYSLCGYRAGQSN